MYAAVWSSLVLKTGLLGLWQSHKGPRSSTALCLPLPEFPSPTRWSAGMTGVAGGVQDSMSPVCHWLEFLGELLGRLELWEWPKSSLGPCVMLVGVPGS